MACIDIVGRGDSGWLQDPQHYHYATYLQQLSAWLAHLNAASIYWIGTSMGGILGMMMAAAANSPVAKLVISDVGNKIPLIALQAIGDYLGKAPLFHSLKEAEEYFRRMHSGFGPLTDNQWVELTSNSVKPAGDKWQVKYDPAIASTFGPFSEDVDLDSYWQRLSCPVLLLRGAESLLFPRPVALQMAEGKQVQLQEFSGVGHAPMMMSDDQIRAVEMFLRG